MCSLTSVHVRLFQRTPSHPSHRRGLWRIRSHNRKCTSDRLTLVPGRLQSWSRHKCSAVKQKLYDYNVSTVKSLKLQFAHMHFSILYYLINHYSLMDLFCICSNSSRKKFSLHALCRLSSHKHLTYAVCENVGVGKK